MANFTPLSATAGGILIGIAVLVLMGLNGRLAGVSGIVGGLLPPGSAEDKGWRVAFIAGLAGAPFLYIAFTSGEIVQSVSENLPLMMAAGLLVGFGSALGTGCTSGHGVCGMARISKRGIIATCTFMATAAITVFVIRHMIGG
ncbi:MAG: YeeE/YedE family protein [Hyphomicrobiales bacterium]